MIRLFWPTVRVVGFWLITLLALYLTADKFDVTEWRASIIIAQIMILIEAGIMMFGVKPLDLNLKPVFFGLSKYILTLAFGLFIGYQIGQWRNECAVLGREIHRSLDLQYQRYLNGTRNLSPPESLANFINKYPSGYRSPTDSTRLRLQSNR